MNFGIVNGQYASQYNMNASLSQAGFQVTINDNTHFEDVELENIISIEKSSFKCSDNMVSALLFDPTTWFREQKLPLKHRSEVMN